MTISRMITRQSTFLTACFALSIGLLGASPSVVFASVVNLPTGCSTHTACNPTPPPPCKTACNPTPPPPCKTACNPTPPPPCKTACNPTPPPPCKTPPSGWTLSHSGSTGSSSCGHNQASNGNQGGGIWNGSNHNTGDSSNCSSHFKHNCDIDTIVLALGKGDCDDKGCVEVNHGQCKGGGGDDGGGSAGGGTGNCGEGGKGSGGDGGKGSCGNGGKDNGGDGGKGSCGNGGKDNGGDGGKGSCGNGGKDNGGDGGKNNGGDGGKGSCGNGGKDNNGGDGGGTAP